MITWVDQQIIVFSTLCIVLESRNKLKIIVNNSFWCLAASGWYTVTPLRIWLMNSYEFFKIMMSHLTLIFEFWYSCWTRINIKFNGSYKELLQYLTSSHNIKNSMTIFSHPLSILLHHIGYSSLLRCKFSLSFCLNCKYHTGGSWVNIITIRSS